MLLTFCGQGLVEGWQNIFHGNDSAHQHYSTKINQDQKMSFEHTIRYFIYIWGTDKATNRGAYKLLFAAIDNDFVNQILRWWYLNILRQDILWIAVIDCSVAWKSLQKIVRAQNINVIFCKISDLGIGHSFNAISVSRRTRWVLLISLCILLFIGRDLVVKQYNTIIF